MLPTLAALAAGWATAQVAPSVTINVSDVGEVVSPGLFGLDLELTRHDMCVPVNDCKLQSATNMASPPAPPPPHPSCGRWSGLSAELVANRMFSVQPAGTTWPVAWPLGFPPRWQPIGSPEVVAPSQGLQCTLSPVQTLCGVQQVWCGGIGGSGGCGGSGA